MRGTAAIRRTDLVDEVKEPRPWQAATGLAGNVWFAGELSDFITVYEGDIIALKDSCVLHILQEEDVCS